MTADSIRIAPSLLAADFARLGDEIKRMEDAGADLFHLDVMDGHFVPNISFGIPVVEAIRRSTRLKLDTHLMISQPDKYLHAFGAAGADSLTVHVEACPHPERVIDAVHALDMECGLAINPTTPVEALFPYLGEVDQALIMSVEPGFGGQSFLPRAVPKIDALRSRIEDRGLSLTIGVDGGVNGDNAPSCAAAGARLLVAGSSVFGAPDAAAAIRSMRSQA